jgi:putative FmdB family regulatory protein
MPTYEYACKKCGEHLEVYQSFKDEPMTECPRCGGALRRVFSPIGIAFKGSGFYKTDSRAGAGKSKSGSSESSDSKPSESKPSESKPSESKPSESKPSSSESKPAASA